MTELEKAQQKIKELEFQLRQQTRTAEPVSKDPVVAVLPNGDLYRGRRPMTDEGNIEIIPEEHQHPMNKAMAQILAAAKGGKNLTCLWCGLQEDGAMAEKTMREHLKSNHPSVVTATPDAEVLMANLAEAQKRLSEASA